MINESTTKIFSDKCDVGEETFPLTKKIKFGEPLNITKAAVAITGSLTGTGALTVEIKANSNVIGKKEILKDDLTDGKVVYVPFVGTSKADEEYSFVFSKATTITDGSLYANVKFGLSRIGD